jgi:hypothetical protein
MGKRFNFERRPADFYPTPKAAVLPLIPFLRASRFRTFAEPCAADGDLVRHLEEFGLHCAYQGDIRTGQDALARDHYGAPVITNPPYRYPTDRPHTRRLLHDLIEHFLGTVSAAPFWLLIDLDWVATLQAVPYLPYCSDIVIIGRVRWIEGSKYDGKDNYGWFRFDCRHNGATAIHRRGEEAALRAGACEQCGRPYQPQRSSARFCSPACKQHAYRKRLSVTDSVTPAPTEVFRYVRHADVPRFTAEGWQATPAPDGTHDGEYSVLMRRVNRDDDV